MARDRQLRPVMEKITTRGVWHAHELDAYVPCHGGPPILFQKPIHAASDDVFRINEQPVQVEDTGADRGKAVVHCHYGVAERHR